MNKLTTVSPGMEKFECNGPCGEMKTILGFYVDRKTKRRSWECKLCRRKRVKGRLVPKNMEAGEWSPQRSEGYSVMQMTMKRKAKRR